MLIDGPRWYLVMADRPQVPCGRSPIVPRGQTPGYCGTRTRAHSPLRRRKLISRGSNRAISVMRTGANQAPMSATGCTVVVQRRVHRTTNAPTRCRRPDGEREKEETPVSFEAENYASSGDGSRCRWVRSEWLARRFTCRWSHRPPGARRSASPQGWGAGSGCAMTMPGAPGFRTDRSPLPPAG
jgi:hypothetical protein